MTQPEQGGPGSTRQRRAPGRPVTGSMRFAALPDVLTPDECRAVMRLGRNAVYEALRRGDLPCIRVGRRILVPKSALVRLLTQRPTGEGEGAE